MDQRWITQPSNMTHKRTDITNMNPASNHRPWSSWPRPGMKKLHKAAITLPAEPRPINFSWSACVFSYQICRIHARWIEVCRPCLESGWTYGLRVVFDWTKRAFEDALIFLAWNSDRKKWRIPPTFYVNIQNSKLNAVWSRHTYNTGNLKVR